MQQPVQITFRDIPHSPAIEKQILEKAKKLEEFFDRITHCRVTIEAPHRHKHKGQLYQVNIDITVPGKQIVAKCNANKNLAHEDAYVAIRDAFNAAQRQLKAYNSKQHETRLH